MRRLLIGAAMIYTLALCACSQRSDLAQWDCTVTAAENSSDSAYVITYSDEKIISATGEFTLENKNAFDITVHLLANGQERTENVPAGGGTILYQISSNIEYTLGCHADVPAGSEIKLFVYDGPNTIHPS